MPMITGVVQATGKDPKIFNTQYGAAYHLKFKMHDGQWYKLPFCEPNEPPPLNKGMTVSFDFTVDQRVNNQQPNGPLIIENTVDRKTLQYLGASEMNQQQYQQPQQQPQQQYPQQQAAPQQNYQNQGPAQYTQQQVPQAQDNWNGKEGMATGVAIQCAARMTDDPNAVMVLAAKIMIIQNDMIKFLEGGGHPQQIIDANPNQAVSGATQQTNGPAPGAGGQMGQDTQQPVSTSQPVQTVVPTHTGNGQQPIPPQANVNAVNNPADQVPYSQVPNMVPNQNMAG